jgi:iron complex transport system ATP-binding protein
MLATENLQIGYGEPINTTPISINFQLGNLVVLLGRNGCGKTTFLRTLGRFLKPISGAVYLDNVPVKQLSAETFARQLSIVTTERIEIAYMKTYDLIALGRYPYLGFLGKLREEDHKAIQAILKDLDIEYLADKYITSCSDGEQQMVLLARALSQDTPIILLDEATAHLDFVNRIKTFQILQKLAVKHNKLIFMATHELEIAMKYAHQVILFQEENIEVNIPQYFIENEVIQAVFAVEGLDYKLKL